MAQTGYEKVTELVGRELTEAWKNIMTGIGSTDNFREQITTDEVIDFLSTVGGAQLDIVFLKKDTAGTQKVFDSFNVVPHFDSLLGGSVSCTGTWSF